MRRKNLALLLVTVTVLGGCFTGCNKNTVSQQDVCRAEGMKNLQEGQYEEAAKLFQKALNESVGEIGDEEYDLCFLKAKALYMAGNTDGAMEVYDAIISYNDCPEAYYFRGNLYYALNEEEKALADYEKAIALDDTDYDMYISVYESLINHNQKTLAESYLNKALEAEGKKSCDDMHKGRIYYCLNDEKLALEFLKKADEAGEKEASFYIAMIYMNASDDRADEYFNKFLETDLATSDRLFEVGVHAANLGKYDQAVRYLEAARSAEGSADKQVLMKNLVYAYEHVGDYTSAKNLLKEYVELYKEDDEAKRELVFLNSR